MSYFFRKVKREVQRNRRKMENVLNSSSQLPEADLDEYARIFEQNLENRQNRQNQQDGNTETNNNVEGIESEVNNNPSPN